MYGYWLFYSTRGEGGYVQSYSGDKRIYYIFFLKKNFSNIGLELIFGFVLSMLKGKGERGFIN